MSDTAREIAELARCIDKVKHTWLTRIREFDAGNGWADTGCVSMVAWLAWWTGTSSKAASEHVRVARALGDLSLIDHAFAAGELTYSKVRALTRGAERATQQTLLDVAKTASIHPKRDRPGVDAARWWLSRAGLRALVAFAGPSRRSMGAGRID